MSSARRAAELELIARSFGPQFLTFVGTSFTTPLSDGGTVTLKAIPQGSAVMVRRSTGQCSERFGSFAEAAKAFVFGLD